MDFAPPVAQNVNVNPNQGLQTLSNILGLKQQQQTLQTGQYQQQQQESQAQSQQEQMRERQWLQQTMQTGKDDQGNSIYGANGEIDPQTMTAAVNRNMPLLGQSISQSILKTQSDKANLDSAVEGLQTKYRTDIGGVLNGFIGSQATPQQINAALDQYATQNPDATEAVHWGENLVDHLAGAPNQQTRDTALSHLIGTFTGTSPQAPTTINTHAGVQGGTVNTATGAITQAGSAVPFAPGPAGAAPYQAGIAAATGAASARATGTAGIDLGRAGAVSNAVQQSSAMIPVTHEIDSLADQVVSGKFAQAISQAAANVHMTAETYARQLLVKDLGQVRSAAIKGAPSVEAADTVLTGFPESTSDPQTIHTSMDLVRGSFQQNLDRGQQLQAFRQKDPTLTGFAQADDQLTSSRTPYQSEFRTLPKGPMRQAFLQRHFQTPDEAQAFVNSIPP